MNFFNSKVRLRASPDDVKTLYASIEKMWVAVQQDPKNSRSTLKKIQSAVNLEFGSSYLGIRNLRALALKIFGVGAASWGVREIFNRLSEKESLKLEAQRALKVAEDVKLAKKPTDRELAQKIILPPSVLT